MEIDIALDRVRFLNDEARRNYSGGSAAFTRGIAALPVDDQIAILERVLAFNDFAPDSDPWDEHAFGAFEHNGQRICWRIEYFDRDGGTYGTSDPADPYLTRRALTIKLVSEY